MPHLEMLVTVKAYPALSTKYGEVVCVAGIRIEDETPKWTRLFPVPFRDLPFDQRFKKYQWIGVDAERHDGDLRPETFRPNPDSLECGSVMTTNDRWRERRRLIDPLMIPSMCWLQDRQREDGTSLGVFRPRQVQAFEYEPVDEWSEDKLAVAAQPSLWFPNRSNLEQVPYRFRYRWVCEDRRCRGHAQSVVDWELAQAFRSWRGGYDEPTLLRKLEEKWLGDMCDASRDTAFFSGNMHRYQESFLVLGVFWPPRES